ncbi:MAG: hypothetical protein IPG25_05330 [Proteobacteria bacterium]|nr:hypothetical protein [Pseudomonadota bacterium]
MPRYDFDAAKQLPDFLCLDASDERGTYGLGVLRDGRVPWRRVADGELLAEVDFGVRNCLSGPTEISA